MSFGIAGGLDPALSPGRLIVATAVIDGQGGKIECHGAWRDELIAALASLSPLAAPLAGRDGAIVTVAEKALLHARHGAAAVDMESHAVARVAARAGLPFAAVDLPGMAEADVIITITSAFAPSLLAEHVSPGTHIACMGTDTKGKQEVEAALLARATVFADEIAQSVSIGEAQHAIAEGLLQEADIAQLGAVINGTHPGRKDAAEITLFDGTGVGLQDLAVAAAVVDLAVAQGRAIEVDF